MMKAVLKGPIISHTATQARRPRKTEITLSWGQMALTETEPQIACVLIDDQADRRSLPYIKAAREQMFVLPMGRSSCVG